jgi:hypothetical protein
MKKALGLLLMVALVALPALAGDEASMVKAGADDVHMGTVHMLNNVVADHDGHRMAVCGCGKEFEVTADSPSMDIHGMTIYACGPECAEHMKSAGAEDMMKAVSGIESKMQTAHMVTNEFDKDGKHMATCACGTEFEVTSKTSCVMADGMKLNACCDGCAGHVLKASAEERHGMMMKQMKNAAAE